MFAPTILTGNVVRPNASPQDTRLPDVSDTQGSSDPFTAAFFNSWSFVEDEETTAAGGEWLPDYREIRHVSGANGCQEAGGGRVNPTAAINGAMSKGAICIRNGDPRMGKYANYLARHIKRTNARGASPFVYCFAPVEWAVVANGTEAVPTNSPAVREWITGFRRQMYLGNLIPPMARQQLNTHLHRLAQRVQRWTEALERGHLTQPAYDSRVNEAKRLQGAMVAAWENQFGDAVKAQIAEAPRIKAEPVTLDTFTADEPTGEPSLTLDPQGDVKAAAVKRAGIAEAQRTPEQIAEVREALSMGADTQLSRFGADRLAEYAAHLEGL